MITKIKVLATGEPSLDTLLPKGHEIEFDSPHVIVVGSNGSGKTAFLRQLYTSLMNAQFYEMHGVMRLRQLISLRSNEIEAKEANHYGISSDKARYFRFLPANTVRSLYVYQNIFPELGFSQDMLLRTPAAAEKIPASSQKAPLTEEQFYKLVQKAAKIYLDVAIPDDVSHISTKPTPRIAYHDTDRLKTFLQKELQQEFPNADDSVFGYVALGFGSSISTLSYNDWVQDRMDKLGGKRHTPLWEVSDERIIKYSDLLTLEEKLQELSSSGEDRAVWTHIRPYSDSKVFGYAASPHINVRSGRMLDPQGVDVKEHHDVNVDFLTFGYSESAASEPSSGTTVMQGFKRHFRAVEHFFGHGRMPTDFYLFDFGKSEYGEKGGLQQRVRKALRFVPMQYRIDIGVDIPALEMRIPENSGLVFLADEPTVYLDIENQRKLTRELFELPVKHPRTQVIIASNDTDFIRAAPEGTVYVVCEKDKPIASTREFKV